MNRAKWIFSLIILLISFACGYKYDLEKLYKNNNYNEIMNYYDKTVNNARETTSTLFISESFVPFLISKQNIKLNIEFEKYLKIKINSKLENKESEQLRLLLQKLIENKYNFIDKAWVVDNLFDGNYFPYGYSDEYFKTMSDELVFSVFFNKLDLPIEIVNRIPRMKKYFDKLNYMKNDDYNNLKNNYINYINKEIEFTDFDKKIADMEKTLRTNSEELIELKRKPVPRETYVRGTIILKEETGIDMFPVTDITIADDSGKIKFGTHDKNLRSKNRGDLISVYLVRIDGQMLGDSVSSVQARAEDINRIQENLGKIQHQLEYYKSIDPKQEIEIQKEKLLTLISEYKMKYQIISKN